MLRVPDGVKVEISDGLAVVKGALGEVKRKIPPKVNIVVNGSSIEISGDKMMVNSIIAHLKNMFKGVTEGYKVKMKILYAHFPITMEVKGKDIIIKNFLGEKIARKTQIVGNTKIEVKGQEIFISGPDKDAVGATISNIKMATKIRRRDSRVFQDGLYIIE